MTSIQQKMRARAQATPLGNRQEKVLAHLQRQLGGTQPAQTTKQIARGINYRHQETDVMQTLLGLEARGLVRCIERRMGTRGSLPYRWMLCRLPVDQARGDTP